MDHNNKYSQMQQNQYDAEASLWDLNNKDYVVGSFEQHNAWSDYDEFLFKDIDTKDKVGLEFGCGPGRNIVRFDNRFNQIDGIDISSINLEKAQIWFKENNLQKTPKLFKNNGVDLEDILTDSYDIVFSTICLQHICVHDIRFNLMKEFYRVLKSGGSFCAQMGFGPDRPGAVDYYDNNYNAGGTNSYCDTKITDSKDLEDDLTKIGFTNFNFDLRPVGPGDQHNNWLFFRVLKP